MTHRPRELAGAVNRASRVCVWIAWSDGQGAYFDVPKTFARAVLTQAREDAAKTGTPMVVMAKVDRDVVYIGSASRPSTAVVREGVVRELQGARTTMADQGVTSVGDTGDTDDDNICDGGCGKIDTSDDEVPVGWFVMHVEHGGETEDEEADGIVCSTACAKAWLDKEWPS